MNPVNADILVGQNPSQPHDLRLAWTKPLNPSRGPRCRSGMFSVVLFRVLKTNIVVTSKMSFAGPEQPDGIIT